MIVFISSVLDDPRDQEFILNIYDQFVRLMYSTAQKYVSNKSDHDDLVQESVLKMIEKIEYIRELDGCILPSYIVSIVRNTSINYLKRQQISQKHLAKIAVQQTTETLEFDELAHLLFCKESLSAIMHQLSQEEQLLIRGKYVLGDSDQELAQQLNCRPDSIRMKLTRTRRKAFNLLIQQDGENND